jgi:hypothetical protein
VVVPGDELLEVVDEIEGLVGQGGPHRGLTAEPERSHGPVVPGQLLQEPLSEHTGPVFVTEVQRSLDHDGEIDEVVTRPVRGRFSHGAPCLDGCCQDALLPVKPA